jgi:hypothetical protein
VRRFEHVKPAVPARQGVNPFTKRAIKIPARPERTTRCDVELEGVDVKERWSWFDEGTAVGEPRSQVHRFPDQQSAEADLAEMVDELLHDGFRELTVAPNEPSDRAARRARPVLISRPASDAAQRLPAAILERCRRKGWFGCDMELEPNFEPPKPDRIEWTRFRYPPASEAQLAETEALLGFSLPATLRTLYATLANGGFGPGYGLVGVIGGAPESTFDTHLAEAYREERALSRHPESFLQWPRRVLRFVEWGCTIWSCIDARTGRILRYDPVSEVPEKDMTPEADSLEEWLERWLSGEEMFPLRRAVKASS